ncbi:hypothetical protein [Sulfurimonas sp.]
MLNIQKAYAREVNGKYEVFSSYLSADEIELEDGEYYAIVVDAEEYSNNDEIEIDAHIVEYEKNHLDKYEYIFLYDDYQSYAYELDALEDEEEDY